MTAPLDQQIPVVFTNRAGLRLFGILHTPTAVARTDVGVLLLSPGVKMRVGPECLYRPMTEMFLRHGFTVFRFDFFGLGDSEGDLKETLLQDVYNHIEVGRYVNDTLDAADWLQREHGLTKFIAAGLCGGAVTGLLSGHQDRRIAGLISLGITPVLASRAADAALYMTVGQLKLMRKKYLRKLFKFGAWFRFLTFRSDYRLIWKSLMKPLMRAVKKPAPAPVPPGNEKQPEDNANPLFPPAFFDMASSGRPMLLVFSGADRLYWEFQEKFVARYAEQLKQVESRYEVHVVPNANHVLSLREWQQDMLAASDRWLEKNFPARAVGSV